MLSFFKCVLCSVLINVHELVLKMNESRVLFKNLERRSLEHELEMLTSPWGR